MLTKKSRILLRRLAVSTISASFILPGTTCGAALGADFNPADKTIQQMFALPPDREQTPETIDLVHKALEEGKRYYSKGEFDKAISKYQESYGLSKEIKYGDGEGKALTEMCIFYQNKGQIPRAKELGENALEVLMPSSDKNALGRARVAVAQCYLGQDNTHMALQQLEQAMKDFTELGAGDSLEAAKVLMLAGGLGLKTGHVKEAMQFFQGAAIHYGQSGDVPKQCSVQLGIASSLLQMGCFMAANEEAAKVVSLARGCKQPEVLKAALACLANCQYNLGEYANARKTYEEVLSMKIKDENPVTTAILEEGYGCALAATGDTENARIFLERALNIVKLKGGANHRAQIGNTLGIIDSLQGKHQAALLNLRAAFEAVSITNPKEERLSVIILQNLAAAESRAGENRAAKNHLLLALQSADTKKFKDSMLIGRSYASLAEVCLALKEVPEAEVALRKGIEISQKISDDAALWRDYTNLARVQILQQQDPSEALTSAVSFFRSPQAGDFPTPDALTYATTREELGQELVSQLVTANFTEQALLTAEQLKEEGFINDWFRRGGQVRPSDRDMYDDLVSQRTHLHAAEGCGNNEALLGQWKTWLRRFQTLAAENPSLARLIAPVPINLQELVKTLQANKTTVVDYLVCNKSTIVFILDSEGRISAQRLAVGRAELNSQVSQLLTASGKSDEASRLVERRTLQLLYNELIADKVQRYLPADPDRTVVFIPDSMLFNLPFAALVTPQNKYLIENHTLTMSPSIGLLLDSQPRQERDLSVAYAGHHTASADDSENSVITSAFDPGRVVKVENGHVDNLQEHAKTSSMLHFASSVPIAKNNPLASLMPLTQDQAKGKVTANQLFNLTLPSDLAVWSATSVNARDTGGNGVQVFSRGLNYAGVRNVLMSLWVEPDPARTSELADFYKNRQQGFNQAQSLRKAQLLSLSKDPSPRSWAAFQLIGPGL